MPPLALAPVWLPQTIDCRHFAFGDGTCPFGSSCFYRHAYRDGSLEVSQTARGTGAPHGGFWGVYRHAVCGCQEVFTGVPCARGTSSSLSCTSQRCPV
jgi:hypothetical protein